MISHVLRKTSTQLGPSSSLDYRAGLPSWVYPVEVLHHLLGAKGEQHVLAAAAAAASSNKQQALKKSLRPYRGSKPASKKLKTTGEQRRITTNKFRCVLSCLAHSMANLVSKNGRDRPETSGRSPVCQVGVCNEGRCSSMEIGLLKDGKWVFNTACTMPWCHTVVHFEVEMSRF